MEKLVVVEIPMEKQANGSFETMVFVIYLFLAHLNLQAHRWACSIGRLPCVAGVLSPFSIIFSEIIGPSESKFLGILHRAEAKEVNMTYMI